jgi:ribosomal protein S1
VGPFQPPVRRQIGQKINVKVLDFDREKEKISLG